MTVDAGTLAWVGTGSRTGLVLWVVACVAGLPALTALVVWLRLRAKERRMDARFWELQKSLQTAGATPIDRGLYRVEGRGARLELHTNPLFRKDFTVRLAVSSNTIHEFELRRGRPVPPEFAAFAPLLERWETAGKMFTECYAAGVTSETDLSGDLRKLIDLAKVPLAREYRGGTFTIREGFEKDVPQWHWRHDLRPKLPPNVRRCCVSYWVDGPLLNPPLARLLFAIAGESRKMILTDTEDLRFLEAAYPRRDLACWGAIVELMRPDLLVAADLHTDGSFFGGMLAGRDVPDGFEVEGMPARLFHEAALKVFRKCDFYARRLLDDEASWWSGEIEILSAYEIDVRGALSKLAGEMGAQVMEIDRRFHKRLVKPLEW
jgi:hypothetical protein